MIYAVTSEMSLSEFSSLALTSIYYTINLRGTPGFQEYDLILSTIGVFLWLIVSFLWNDRALILLNGLGLVFLIKNNIMMWI